MTDAPRRGASAPARRAAWAALALALTLACAAPATAHGLDVTAERGQAARVRGVYDDGEPMSFVKVKISGPDGKTFQVGNSDARGRFAWLPDRDGAWKAVLSDGMGHRGEATLVWRAAESRQAAPAAPPVPPSGGIEAAPRWARAVWGLSVICFLAGGLFWLRARRLLRAVPKVQTSGDTDDR